MIFNKLSEKREININDWKTLYSSENGYDITPFQGDLKESTYFSSLKIISESVAKCPIQIKKENEKGESISREHYLYNLLKLRPNPYMNAIDCFKSFVALAKHEGIAGLYINRNRVRIEGLYPVKITSITIDNAGLIKGVKGNKILYDFTGVNGETGSCFDKDLIVLRDFSLDGINADATRKILNKTLDTSVKSQNYLNTLFTNGLTNRIVIQLSGDLKDEKEITKVQDKFSRIYSNNGKVFTVPAGYSVSSLNLSLSDACYPELRKMSKEEIASMMGVPLTKLGFVKENAKSEEQDNLKFLQDTLLVIFEAIEQELDWKLLTEIERKQGYKIRFNINVLLRMDSKTQAEVISTYVKNGVYSLNIAKEILGIEKLDKDVTTFPSGQVTLEQMLSGKVSYAKVGDEDDNS